MAACDYPDVAETTVIGPRAKVHPSATVYDFAVIRDSVIGPGAVVSSFSVVRESTLEAHTMVGAHAEVARSTFEEGSGMHSGYVGDSHIGEQSRLGAGTVIANNRLDDPVGENRDGATIGADVRTGINCAIMPGVEIGDGAVIGPGTIVLDDVVSGGLCYAEQGYGGIG